MHLSEKVINLISCEQSNYFFYSGKGMNYYDRARSMTDLTGSVAGNVSRIGFRFYEIKKLYYKNDVNFHCKWC